MFGKLTGQQRRIVLLLVEGHDNYSIAEKLHISVKTVKNHLYLLYKKLDVYDKTQVVIMYYKEKIKALETEIQHLRGEENGPTNG